MQGDLTVARALLDEGAARYRKLGVTLPYFIPMPPPFMLGTLGAVITMQTDRARRNALMDIGATLCRPRVTRGILQSEI